MSFLIIEDDEDKLQTLDKYLHKQFPTTPVLHARSFSSGLRTALEHSSALTVILLDMSMPSFDVSAQEPSGGTPEPFAGREFLAQMQLRGLNTPTIVVTMFDHFTDKEEKTSLHQLNELLSEKFSPPYTKTIHFNPRQEGWQAELLECISDIVKS